MSDKKLNILHGPGPICGQAWAICEGLKVLGQNAESGVIHIEGQDHNRYKYPYNREINIEGGWIDGVGDFLLDNIHNYDVFHFHARSFYHFNPWPRLPTALDLFGLKLAGKIIVFHFRGSEVRRASMQRQNNPYHYVDDSPQSFAKSDEDKLQYINYIKAIADKIFVVDREVQEYVGDAIEVPICLNLSDWRYIGQVSKSDPLVLHAPSHRGIKGTQQVLAAIENLKNKGLKFRFELVENLANADARKLYEKSDIIIDQLRMGWFGTLTVEAMALGKPVICYLRDDLLKDPEELPIVNANPNNIESVLEKLIVDSQLRNNIAISGRDYAEKYHSNVYAANVALDAYRDAVSAPKQMSAEIFFKEIMPYFNNDQEIIKNMLKLNREKMRKQQIVELKKIKIDIRNELKNASFHSRVISYIKIIKNKLSKTMGD